MDFVILQFIHIINYDFITLNSLYKDVELALVHSFWKMFTNFHLNIYLFDPLIQLVQIKERCVILCLIVFPFSCVLLNKQWTIKPIYFCCIFLLNILNCNYYYHHHHVNIYIFNNLCVLSFIKFRYFIFAIHNDLCIIYL